MHARLVVWIVALGIATSGCSLLSPSASTASALSPGAAPQAALPPEGGVTAALGGRTTFGPYPKPSQQEAMRQIAPALREIAAASPTAHAEVLEQLGGAPPEMWSLVIERAQSTLAYRQQLAGETPADSTPVAAQLASTQPVAQQPVENGATRRALPPTAPRRDPGVVTTSAQEPVAPPATDAARLPRVDEQPSGPVASPHMVGGAGNSPQMIQNHHLNDGAAGGASRVVTASAIIDAPFDDGPDRMSDNLQRGAGPIDWRTSLDAAITVLQSSAPASPQSTDEAYQHARLRLLQLAAGRQGAAMQSIPGLHAVEQGYWSNQLFALSTMLDSPSQPERRRRAAAASMHQSQASAKLRSLGSLQVRNMAFCSAVYGYGAYEPLESATYRPGDQAVLYAEIDNYHSQSNEDGYRTSLASSYRLIDSEGQTADSGDFPLVDDVCLSPRRDFHIQYGVALPGRLAPGTYRLELTVTDQLGDKIGRDEATLVVSN